ncbi:MAG: hypothetical protein KJ626_00070 [Verrucomicrobia bacterium]|nr:hypothetical protein [Verrucomicrobiota bacterium]
MSFFDNRDKKEGKAHFRDLAILAMVDGKIEPSESQFLSVVGDGCGLTREEMTAVITDLQSAPVDIPFGKDKRREQLNDMIALMVVDRQITSDELDFVMRTADKLGFSVDETKNLLAVVMQGIQPSNWSLALMGSCDSVE